jgi:hypothetical protein
LVGQETCSWRRWVVGPDTAMSILQAVKSKSGEKKNHF